MFKRLYRNSGYHTCPAYVKKGLSEHVNLLPIRITHRFGLLWTVRHIAGASMLRGEDQTHTAYSVVVSGNVRNSTATRLWHVYLMMFLSCVSLLSSQCMFPHTMTEAAERVTENAFGSKPSSSFLLNSVATANKSAPSTSSTYSTGSSSTASLNFLTPEQIQRLAVLYGTPLYVYDCATLQKSAEEALAFPAAFGLTVRYAMKASPNAALLQLFTLWGIHLDASSGYEVLRALKAGVPASHISLSTQEYPSFFPELHKQGIHFNACSLSQLESFGRAFPGTIQCHEHET